MNKFFLLVMGLCCLLLTQSCVKERTDNINYFKSRLGALDSTGNVVINEYVARGATLDNELGTPSDWIELYNTGDSVVNFAITNYYVTDDSTQPEKYVIKEKSIGPKGFLVIYCDDSNTVRNSIHTNFGLSKSGSFIGLSKRSISGTLLFTTRRVFGPQGSNISEGLLPDGGTTWSTFPSPTPGAPNR